MKIPVYLFTGFLESGKSTFITDTLNDKEFVDGEKTLLLLCEEGEIEFDAEKLAKDNVFCHIIDDPTALDPKMLSSMLKKFSATRVLIEYNGMWPISELLENMPENWQIYQQMFFADSNTILTFNANMRNLVFDKVSGSELVIFNRMKDDTDKMPLHKLIRQISRNIPIIYEYEDGSIENDMIEDPLPFDISKEFIEIEDNDFGLWYRDLMEDIKKYEGKTVKFKAIIARDKRLDKNSFAAGRHIMTCCADDIQYGGLVAICENECSLAMGDWINLTAKIVIMPHKLYNQTGPVLKVIDYAHTSAPEQKVVTFQVIV